MVNAWLTYHTQGEEQETERNLDAGVAIDGKVNRMMRDERNPLD